MNFLHLFLAWRYTMGTRQNRAISIMAYISFFGILIGSFSLTLTLFIMHGFEKATHEQLQGIHAHIIMRAHGSQLAADKIMGILNTEFAEVIEATSPTDSSQIIVQSYDCEERTSLVMVKGIDPHLEQRIGTLSKKIISTKITPQSQLNDFVQENKILIGAKLAQDIEVTVGDPIALIVPDHSCTKKSIRLEQHDGIIGGIFATGIDEFDSSLIFCSLDFLHSISPNAGVTQLNIKLKPHADDEKVLRALRARFPLEVYSWKELYPALVSALTLEKYVMACILALITLVASMNIISLFFMHITQKRGDIAILRAMGMHNIGSIFLLMNSIITGIATTCGIALASIVGFLLDRYPIITLPDAYYISKLPVAVEWHLALLIFCAIMLLGTIAAWIPLRGIRTITIAQILRFEA